MQHNTEQCYVRNTQLLCQIDNCLCGHSTWQQQLLATWIEGAVIAHSKETLDSLVPGDTFPVLSRLATTIVFATACIDDCSARRASLNMLLQISHRLVHITSHHIRQSQSRSGTTAALPLLVPVLSCFRQTGSKASYCLQGQHRELSIIGHLHAHVTCHHATGTLKAATYDYLTLLA